MIDSKLTWSVQFTCAQVVISRQNDYKVKKGILIPGTFRITQNNFMGSDAANEEPGGFLTDDLLNPMPERSTPRHPCKINMQSGQSRALKERCGFQLRRNHSSITAPFVNHCLFCNCQIRWLNGVVENSNIFSEKSQFMWTVFSSLEWPPIFPCGDFCQNPAGKWRKKKFL